MISSNSKIFAEYLKVISEKLHIFDLVLEFNYLTVTDSSCYILILEECWKNYFVLDWRVNCLDNLAQFKLIIGNNECSKQVAGCRCRF